MRALRDLSAFLKIPFSIVGTKQGSSASSGFVGAQFIAPDCDLAPKSGAINLAPTIKKAGFTLVELVIAIVVVGIAASGVLLVMNYTTAHSADPMIQHQAVAIAESYLEEVLLQPYSDPDGVAVTEATRSLFDDLDDYNFTDDVARDQSGAALPELAAYGVTVEVTPTTLNGVTAKKIDVTVTHASGINMTLTGYRTDY